MRITTQEVGARGPRQGQLLSSGSPFLSRRVWFPTLNFRKTKGTLLQKEGVAMIPGTQFLARGPVSLFQKSL